jgi:FixJ family two-component response regulator
LGQLDVRADLPEKRAAMTQPLTRVAIVDDDSSVRKALARLLGAHCFETNTYESASDFLKSVAINRPTCLVLDLHMADITGLDLQRYLRRAGIEIPTIVITAYDEPGIRERCHHAGAAAFLIKPLDSTILIGAINAATGRA